MIRLMHSFKGLIAPQAVLDAVHRGEIAAFCLFAYNIESPEQLRELTESIYAAAAEGGQPVPIIGIDQEGGQLMAVANGATELPGNMALGATRSPELAEKAGWVLGRELLAMGVNLNFAPAMDVNNNPENPVIGIRSFGDDPALVAELGVAMIRGMQKAGIIATAKHFPGHGDVAVDTHHQLPVVERSIEDLERLELAPFRAALADGVKAVLTAHVIYPALDAENPATLSKRIITGLLREELGYDGLVITDAMDMGAVAVRGNESLRQALDAGVDLVLLGHLPDQLELQQVFNNYDTPESTRRIRSVQADLPTALPSIEIVGHPEHRAIAQEIADAAITVVRGHENLPLRPTPDERILVITPQATNLTPADTSAAVKIALAQSIAQRHAQTEWLELPFFGSSEDIQPLLSAAQNADMVIVGTIAADRLPRQAELVQKLIEQGSHPIVVSLRTPYDICAFPNVETYICAYGIRQPNVEAVAKVLFGELLATGQLPCRIPGINAVAAVM